MLAKFYVPLRLKLNKSGSQILYEHNFSDDVFYVNLVERTSKNIGELIPSTFCEKTKNYCFLTDSSLLVAYSFSSDHFALRTLTLDVELISEVFLKGLDCDFDKIPIWVSDNNITVFSENISIILSFDHIHSKLSFNSKKVIKTGQQIILESMCFNDVRIGIFDGKEAIVGIGLRDIFIVWL